MTMAQVSIKITAIAERRSFIWCGLTKQDLVRQLGYRTNPMNASKENNIDLDVPSVSTAESVGTHSDEVTVGSSIPEMASNSHETKPDVEQPEAESVELKTENAPAELAALPKAKRSHKAKPAAKHPESEIVEAKTENAVEVGSAVSPDAELVVSESAAPPKVKRSHKAKPAAKHPESEIVEAKTENPVEVGSAVSPDAELVVSESAAQPKAKRSHKAKPVAKQPESETVQAKVEIAPEVGAIVSAEAVLVVSPEIEAVASAPKAQPKAKSSSKAKVSPKAKSAGKHPEAGPLEAKAENTSDVGSIVSSEEGSAVSSDTPLSAATTKAQPKAKSPSKAKVPSKAKPVVINLEAEPVDAKTENTHDSDTIAPEAKPKAKISHKAKPSNLALEAKSEAKEKKEKIVELPLVAEPVSKKGIVSKPMVVKNESTRPIHGSAAPAKTSVVADDSDQKTGVRRKGPIGSKGKKVLKTSKSEFGMRMCVRCPNPFEPVEESEVVCPKCKDAVNMRFSQLFGDEDPYSPQPTLRTNKIARVIFRNSKKTEAPETFDRDIAEESLEPIDRYDDE